MKNHVKNTGILVTLSKVLILSIFAIFLVSCENEDKFLPETSADAELKAASLKKGTDPIAQIAFDEGFSELLSALTYVDSVLQTDFVDLFSNGKDQYTVFAPTDDAFWALYTDLGVGKISDLPAESVLDILLYHVTDGRRASNSVVPKMNVRNIETLLDESFTVNIDRSINAIGNTAAITSADISASNGIIHVIDAVLLPVDLETLLHRTRLKIGRALLEVQAPEVDVVLPYYTYNIEYHDPVVNIYGIEDMTAFLNQLIVVASPNLVTIVVDETLIDDIYSATWVMSGDFLGVPYEAKGISIFKFLPNLAQVYYQRDYYSEGDIMATIPGLDQAIGGFRAYYRCAVDPTFECPFPTAPVSTENNQLSVQNQINNDQLEVGRQLVEIHAGNWTNVLPFLANNYEYHDPIVDIYGPETMAAFLGRLFVGSSNLYTIVEDETLTDDIYMATWTMAGEFNGAPFSAPGMSIVKFVEGTTQTYYSRDYYTEGDVMLGVPQLADAVLGFRQYYRSAVDPTFMGSE